VDDAHGVFVFDSVTPAQCKKQAIIQFAKQTFARGSPRKRLHFTATVGFAFGVPPPIKGSRIDLGKIRTYPLASRRSLTTAGQIAVDPASEPPALPAGLHAMVRNCAQAVRQARERNAAVMLLYGAHLLRNGAAPVVDELLQAGWITHLATNGAGSIHDWEYAWLGRSTESVRENVATGTFGTWDETSRCSPAHSGKKVTATRWAGSSRKTALTCPPSMNCGRRSAPIPTIRSALPDANCFKPCCAISCAPAVTMFSIAGKKLPSSPARFDAVCH
jgi:hypothetical protein